MKTIIKTAISLTLACMAFSCMDLKSPTSSDGNPTIRKATLGGLVQKGPYINGTSITVSELGSDLAATGKNFNTQIVDNQGAFELKNVELSSQYVQLKANGFYFNEVTNQKSAAQLTMYALSDITDRSTVNVNMLSHLEKARVEYLIGTGEPFALAKKKAQEEILSLFNISPDNMNASESLDISQTGNANAILLALSVILQGHRTVAELSELLANISSDIREDGTLESGSLGSALINHAKYLDLAQIRANLVGRYKELGVTASIGDFESHVANFIAKSGYAFTNTIRYPQSGSHGSNFLSDSAFGFKAYETYSMCAVLPRGTELKVKVSSVTPHAWWFRVDQQSTGWKYSEYDDTDGSRVFTSTTTGQLDFGISLSGTAKFEAFENGSKIAAVSRTIVPIKPDSSDSTKDSLGMAKEDSVHVPADTSLFNTADTVLHVPPLPTEYGHADTTIIPAFDSTLYYSGDSLGYGPTDTSMATDTLTGTAAQSDSATVVLFNTADLSPAQTDTLYTYSPATDSSSSDTTTVNSPASSDSTVTDNDSTHSHYSGQ